MVETLSRDRFLGGKLTLNQPVTGYRAGVDPVLLAAAVRARADQSVLDIGCGVGTAALCLGRRIPGLRLSGLEVQPDHAALARRNADENGLAFDVVEGSLADMPAPLKARQFDHVIMNPPYFDRATGSAAPDPARETALGGGDVALSQWVDAAAKRLAPKGHLSVIQRAERLPELLGAVAARFGSLQLLPLIPRPGRDSQLVILRARKGGRAPLRLHAGLILHAGDSHIQDGENYTETIRSVLRDAAALPFPD
jgi:tRNA1(Val) A37 N6-methylase TrmN6